MQELLVHATSFEKAKFTYWRAEERRRVKHKLFKLIDYYDISVHNLMFLNFLVLTLQILAIGTWSSLQDASNNEIAAKICNLLGLKYNAALEIAVRQQTALVVNFH